MVSIPTKNPEPEALAVANWIRRILSETGISQKEAAKAIGSPSLNTFASRLTRGYIDVVMLMRIAKLAGVSETTLSEILQPSADRGRR